MIMIISIIIKSVLPEFCLSLEVSSLRFGRGENFLTSFSKTFSVSSKLDCSWITVSRWVIFSEGSMLIF